MSEKQAPTSINQRRSATERREATIAAARSLFALRGFHGTGMSEIAKVSNVLVGQIYRDFASKEDLIAAIVERDLSELLDDPELNDTSGAGNASRLIDWTRRFIDRRLDEDTRRMLPDILSEAARNPRIAAILDEAYACLRHRLAEAAKAWNEAADRQAQRQDLADLILTAAVAVQHMQIFGLPLNDAVVARLIATVDADIATLRSS